MFASTSSADVLYYYVIKNYFLSFVSSLVLLYQNIPSIKVLKDKQYVNLFSIINIISKK